MIGGMGLRGFWGMIMMGMLIDIFELVKDSESV